MLFKVAGFLVLGTSAFGVILGLSWNPLGTAIGGFFGIVNGLALIALGDVIEYTEYLKKKLNIYLPREAEETLPQVTCPTCGSTHDFDYPKCPSCGVKGKVIREARI